MKYKVFLRNKETFKTFYELEIHFFPPSSSLHVNQLIEKGIWKKSCVTDQPRLKFVVDF